MLDINNLNWQFLKALVWREAFFKSIITWRGLHNEMGLWGFNLCFCAVFWHCFLVVWGWRVVGQIFLFGDDVGIETGYVAVALINICENPGADGIIGKSFFLEIFIVLLKQQFPC
jgi:hypothetical protein